MGSLSVSERLADYTSAPVDSSVLKTAGPAWHKPGIRSNRLPVAGTDTDGSTGKLVVPLFSDVSTANIHDSQKFNAITEPLAGLFQNILADPTYDDDSLYDSDDSAIATYSWAIKILHMMMIHCMIQPTRNIPD